MPRSVRDKIIKMLKDGIFHHTAASKIRPSKHQLCQKMWDSEFKSLNWIHITYENWFILSGVYDQKKLSESSGGKGIMKALLRRYGQSIGTSLAYKNGPIDAGTHVQAFITQLGDRVLSNTEEMSKLKLENEKLHDRVRAVKLENKTLRDRVGDGYSAANDGSYDMDYYDDAGGDYDHDHDAAW